IGPGTGIAPFRAFLQQRAAQQSGGKNWLITGNPHEKSDFLYETELTDFVRQGVLTELTTAWSRDQSQKIYVQDKLAERREAVWRWLEQGAYLYVCGDAFRMAKDVDAALLDIIRSEGAMSAEEALVFSERITDSKALSAGCLLIFCPNNGRNSSIRADLMGRLADLFGGSDGQTDAITFGYSGLAAIFIVAGEKRYSRLCIGQ
ncbi:hypothetical protein ABN09_04605, partial [Morganella morganii]